MDCERMELEMGRLNRFCSLGSERRPVKSIVVFGLLALLDFRTSFINQKGWKRGLNGTGDSFCKLHFFFVFRLFF